MKSSWIFLNRELTEVWTCPSQKAFSKSDKCSVMTTSVLRLRASAPTNSHAIISISLQQLQRHRCSGRVTNVPVTWKTQSTSGVTEEMATDSRISCLPMLMWQMNFGASTLQPFVSPQSDSNNQELASSYNGIRSFTRSITGFYLEIK